MGKETFYNYNSSSPAQVTRELYSNVGNGDNFVGNYPRAVKSSTDFEIWDSVSGGIQLTEGVDYELRNQDKVLTAKSGFDVYAGYKILNVTYQTGNIYITYKVVQSYNDADIQNDLRTEVDTNTSDIITLQSQILVTKSKLTLEAGGFWGDIIYKDADEIVIKPKGKDGITPWIGAILNDGSFIEDSIDYTIKYDTPGNSGHIIDDITAKLNNEWFIIWAYEDSGNALAFGITWMANTTFSNANPTNALTLNQINSQDIGKLFAPGGHVVVWQDTNELETPFGYADGGAFTYDVTNDIETSIASTITTVLTLGGTLNNATFTAGSIVYQVDGFKPLQVSDGAVASVIGARGYKDTGFRFRTGGSGNILPFTLENNTFYYVDGTGSADLRSAAGGMLENTTIVVGYTNYLFTYLPPDKDGLICLRAGNIETYFKRYSFTYGANMVVNDGTDAQPMYGETQIKHRILSTRVNASTATVGILGYVER